MELEQLQQQWKAMNTRLESLEIIQKNQIMEITKNRYKNTFSTLLQMETVGAVVCVLFAVAILFSYQKFDTIFYQVLAVSAFLFFTLLPYFTLKYIKGLKKIPIGVQPVAATLKDFYTIKTKLLNTQKIAVSVGALMYFITIPLFSKMMGKDNFFEKLDMFAFVFTGIVFVAIAIFSYWGFTKYKRITDKAASILQELKEEAQ